MQRRVRPLCEPWQCLTLEGDLERHCHTAIKDEEGEGDVPCGAEAATLQHTQCHAPQSGHSERSVQCMQW
jgi:hypothetical protein